MIVDDIMYLRSMRRQVYNLVRDHADCALLTVHVTCDFDLAQQRNQSRVGIERVAEASFDNVVQHFQPPTSKHICDRQLLVLENNKG